MTRDSYKDNIHKKFGELSGVTIRHLFQIGEDYKYPLDYLLVLVKKNGHIDLAAITSDAGADRIVGIFENPDTPINYVNLNGLLALRIPQKTH